MPEKKKSKKAKPVKAWMRCDSDGRLMHYHTAEVYRTRRDARDAAFTFERIARVEIREV